MRSFLVLPLFLWACDSTQPADTGHPSVQRSDGALLDLGFRLLPDRSGSGFAARIAAGDLDDDWLPEVVVSAPSCPFDSAACSEVLVYPGTDLFTHDPAPIGLSPPCTDYDPETAEYPSYFGSALATPGDLDRDGFADLVVVAGGLGTAYLFRGSADGVEPTPSWSFSPAHGTWLSVDGAGDVNLDGFLDLVIGSHAGAEPTSGGEVYVFLGARKGLSEHPNQTIQAGVPGLGFGADVAGVGDVDGDGFDDVLVGSNSSDGGAWLFTGSFKGLRDWPAWQRTGGEGAGLGAEVAAAGDVNGDGYADVLVGADDNAWLYTGSAKGLCTTAAWHQSALGIGLGTSLSAAGDVDGDGYGDVVIGAPYYTGLQALDGFAEIFLGSPGGLDRLPSWLGSAGVPDARYGVELVAAGDLDGDGYDDLLASAPDFRLFGYKPAGIVCGYLGGPGAAADGICWPEGSELIPPSHEDLPGCGCATSPRRGPIGALSVALLALILLRRRSLIVLAPGLAAACASGGQPIAGAVDTSATAPFDEVRSGVWFERFRLRQGAWTSSHQLVLTSAPDYCEREREAQARLAGVNEHHREALRSATVDAEGCRALRRYFRDTAEALRPAYPSDLHLLSLDLDVPGAFLQPPSAPEEGVYDRLGTFDRWLYGSLSYYDKSPYALWAEVLDCDDPNWRQQMHVEWGLQISTLGGLYELDAGRLTVFDVGEQGLEIDLEDGHLYDLVEGGSAGSVEATGSLSYCAVRTEPWLWIGAGAP